MDLSKSSKDARQWTAPIGKWFSKKVINRCIDKQIETESDYNITRTTDNSARDAPHSEELVGPCSNHKKNKPTYRYEILPDSWKVQ